MRLRYGPLIFLFRRQNKRVRAKCARVESTDK